MAIDEATVLETSGMVGENVGEAPFVRESVPTVAITAMAVIV